MKKVNASLFTFAMYFAVSASPLLATGVCAHRGEHRTAPENTIPAFIAAVKMGVQQIEFDVHSTKDGKMIIMHDATVDRTTNGKGKILDMTFDEVRALDAGSKFDKKFAGTKVPIPREALEAIPPSIICNVHINGGPETAADAARLIRDMGRLKQCFLAISEKRQEVWIAARKAVPGIMICKGAPAEKELTEAAVSLADSSDIPNLSVKQLAAQRVEYIQFFYWKPEPPAVDFLRNSVNKLHEMGIKVTYCCGDNEKIILMLIEAGVDYILTDENALCLELTGKKKK
ncbi:MAG: glycerophosphodiester phosphodiesterase family protein [Candidatus Latescibacter sp.]|nr:glycerophosphodiester phosphodiesterase family protein [Candidatus Latescibacter sp.]